MAREIVLTTYDTNYSGLPSSIYLYPSLTAVVNGGDGHVITDTDLGGNDDAMGFGCFFYTHYTIQSPSSWQQIPYAGHNTIDAKFMAGNTNKWLIYGMVADPRDGVGGVTNAIQEALVISRMRTLLQYNKELLRFDMTINGTSVVSSAGCIIGAIMTDHFGQGTGPRWPFTMEIIDLGK